MKNGTLCKIKKTNSSLDGVFVLIKGVCSEQATATFYIVERVEQEFFEDGYSCIALTEHCLERV